MLSNFGILLIFISTVIIFVLSTFVLSRLLRNDKPNPVKLSTYESGEESIGALNSTFNPKYYIIALAFLLFEVELILLFPWALAYSNKTFIGIHGKAWFWLAYGELAIFIALLSIGLAYIWHKGYFDWGTKTKGSKQEIPEIYKKFNEQIN